MKNSLQVGFMENEGVNQKQLKTFTKNFFNISNGPNGNKIPAIKQDNFYNPPATANVVPSFSNLRIKNESADFSNKEHLKEFFANKKKVNLRLNSLYKESVENINALSKNNSVGQRVLIKNQRGNNIEDRFSKTTKVSY